MPPKKRKSREVDDLAGKAELAVEAPPHRRVTRSGGMPPLSPSQISDVPANMKGKKPKTTVQEEKTNDSESSDESDSSDEPDSSDESDSSEEEPVVEDADADASGSAPTTVIIEHSLQCDSFYERARQVKEGLENGLPDIKVVVNPVKPRRGCFEIRAEGQHKQKFFSLLDLKKPYKRLKLLNIEEVIADIINKIQA